MRLDRRVGVLILVDAATWAAWSAAIGYGVHRMPRRCFDRDRSMWRLRRWEADGRVYTRLGARRWKDRLPEAGALFAGGSSKRRLEARDRAGLERFAAETRRAELVHWLIPAFTPLFAAWNPTWLVASMAAYAAAANAPCIVVQRYNRGRVLRALRRSGRAGT